MFATSMRGIHERFDRMEKAIQALAEQQKTNERKLEQIMTSKVLKSKVLVIKRTLNFSVTVKPVNYNKDILPVSADKKHFAVFYSLPSVYRVIKVTFHHVIIEQTLSS